MINKNDNVKLNIRDVTLDGDGVGSISDSDESRVVFCFGAKPGEERDATVTKVTTSWISAKLNDRTSVSSSLCKNFPKCGGCSLLHFTYDETLALKQKSVSDCIKRIGGLDIKTDPILGSPEISGYRNKTIYRFAKPEGRVVCGFFRRNSHDVVPISDCFIENELSRKIRTNFVRLVEKFKLSVYDEKSARGFLRGLMVRTSISENAAQVVIIGTFGKLPDGFISDFLTAVTEITSLYLNINKTPGNAVLSDNFVHLAGNVTLSDKIGPGTFEISPESFFQVNPFQTPNLYEKAYEFAEMRDGDVLLDLFCGIGTIGQYFAKRMEADGLSLATLTGVEYTKAAVVNAGKNALINDLKCDVHFHSGDCGEVLKTLDVKPTVVVVDPPRKGCDASVIDAVSSLETLSRIVYISCNPSTLARDLKLFAARGFVCERACPVDMFPFAGHVESVCLLSRKTPV